MECIKRAVNPHLTLSQYLVNLRLPDTQSSQSVDMLQSMLRNTSQQKGGVKALHEKAMLWAVKFNRLQEQECGDASQRSLSYIFDYFVRREVTKKLAEERLAAGDEQVFTVPFAVREQAIPSVVGKAMDEWTKEDVAKMEAEAEKEIEENFPSYFDEVQKSFFSGHLAKEGRRSHTYDLDRALEVDIEQIFAEFMGVTKKEERSYRSLLLKDRLEVVQLSL